MMDAIWSEGPLTGLVNNAAANFITPDERPEPARLSRRHLDRDGRQLSCDARRWQALDRGRT